MAVRVRADSVQNRVDVSVSPLRQPLRRAALPSEGEGSNVNRDIASEFWSRRGRLAGRPRRQRFPTASHFLALLRTIALGKIVRGNSSVQAVPVHTAAVSTTSMNCFAENPPGYSVWLGSEPALRCVFASPTHAARNNPSGSFSQRRSSLIAQCDLDLFQRNLEKAPERLVYLRELWVPARSEPVNNQLLRPSAIGRMRFSTQFLSIGRAPSSM